jgi:hypothetical protein
MCFEGFGSLQIGLRLRCMLTAVNFKNQASCMAGEVGDIAANANLPAEVGIWSLQAMPEVPPELPLSICRIGTHLAPEDTLRRYRHATISASPGARLFIVFRHRSTRWRDPHPYPLPTRGRGTERLSFH